MMDFNQIDKNTSSFERLILIMFLVVGYEELNAFFNKLMKPDHKEPYPKPTPSKT
jgi:hypothetical protein